MDNEKEFDLRKRAYAFSVKLVLFLKKLVMTRGFLSLLDQTLRSGTSIGANIIEAKAASSTKEYIRYYQISLKSGNEAQYWLSLIRGAEIPGCKPGMDSAPRREPERGK
jgi:four helix bundle protein